MNRLGLASTLIIVALVFVFALTSVTERLATPDMRFVITPQPVAELVHSAHNSGMFSARGLRVAIVNANTPVEAEGLIERGEVDGGFFPYSTALQLVTRSVNTRVVANVDYSAGADGIVATTAVQSVVDLRGRRVAVSQEGFGQFLLASALSHYGLTVTDVVTVPLEPLQAVQAYLRGNVEAIVATEPFLNYTATQPGSHLIYSSSAAPGLMPDVIIFRSEYLNGHRTEVAQFLNIWFDLVEQLNGNELRRREHLSIVAIALRQSLAEIERMFHGIQVLDFADNAVAFTRGTDSTSLYGSGFNLLALLYPASEAERSLLIEAILDPSFVRSGLNP